jgi:hypothetical protein
VVCLHQLYLFGAAMQLKRMGYHMTKMNWYEEDYKPLAQPSWVQLLRLLSWESYRTSHGVLW